MADAVGRVAAVPIPSGSPGDAAPALQEGGREALAFQVPRGMRAVTIAVSDVTGVAGLVRAGNFVDLVGIFEYGVPSGQRGRPDHLQPGAHRGPHARAERAGRGGGRASSRAPRAPRAPARAGGTEPRRRCRRPSEVEVQSMTLLVSPQQVQEVVLAQQVGTLTVSLRSNLDAGQVVDLPRLDPLTMLKVQTPVPLKTRRSRVWREIRGTQP